MWITIRTIFGRGRDKTPCSDFTLGKKPTKINVITVRVRGGEAIYIYQVRIVIYVFGRSLTSLDSPCPFGTPCDISEQKSVA
jgi:hypothetical protein